MASPYTGNSIAGGDGNIFVDTGGTWANVKSLTTGTAQAATDPVNCYTARDDFGGAGQRSISRLFFPFTNTIPTDQLAYAGSPPTLTLNITSLDGTNSTFHVVQSTEASTSSLANGDFANIPGAGSTMTSFGSLAISTTGSKVFTLNAAGIAYINSCIAAGTAFKLALAEDHDVTNTDPPATTHYRIVVNMSENGTVGNRPLLTIPYIAGGKGLFFAQI